MRVLDPGLSAHLASGATTLCRCWAVRRGDGVAFGFTDHDDDLEFDGQTFRARAGMDGSALKSATGLSVDNLTVVGALTDAGVTEEDIRAGRFDGAEARQWLVNWRRPEQRMLLFFGTFGEIVQADRGFEVELRGPAEALNVAMGRNLLRRCDALLGDERCGVNTADPAYSVEVVVEAATATRITASGLHGFAQGWFTGGKLVWQKGRNAGLSGRLRADQTGPAGERILSLWEESAFEIAPGDLARVMAGCDKLAETCREKFANFLNFRGFPHIPGEDWVTAYPKDGEYHDGGSRS